MSVMPPCGQMSSARLLRGAMSEKGWARAAHSVLPHEPGASADPSAKLATPGG